MNKQDYVGYYSGGSNNYISRSVNILRILFEVFPAVVFLLLLGKTEKTPDMTFYINLLIFHASLAVATMDSAYMARMTMYTAPFAIIAICNLLSSTGRNGKILEITFILTYSVFGWYEIFSDKLANSFQWIWNR